MSDEIPRENIPPLYDREDEEKDKIEQISINPSQIDERRERLGLGTSAPYQRQTGAIPEKPEPNTPEYTLANIIAAEDDPMAAINYINAAQYISKTFDLDLGETYNSLEEISEHWLGTIKPPEAFLRDVQSSWKNGMINYDRAKIGGQLRATGGDNEELLLRLEELSSEMIEIETPRPWLKNAFLIATESAPLMLQSFLKGGTMAGAAGATAGAMMGGTAAPLTAGLSVPAMTMAMASVGFAVGSTKDLIDTMKGLQYLDLRDKDVPHDLAGPISDIAGTVQGAIESVGNILLGVKIPGVSSVLKSAGTMVTNKLMMTGTLGVIGTRLAANTIAGGLSEGIEEPLQELVSAFSEQLSRELAKNKGIEVDIAPLTAGALVERTTRAFAGGFSAGIIFGVAGAPGGIRADVKRLNQVKELSKSIESRKKFIDGVISNDLILPNSTADKRGWRDYLGKVWDKQHPGMPSGEAAPLAAATTQAQTTEDGAPAAAPEVEYRKKDGRLFTVVQELSGTKEGVNAILKVGDPEKGVRYGYILFEHSAGDIYIEAIVNEGESDLRREMLLELMAEFPSAEIQWDPIAEDEIDIKEELIANNPRGTEGIQRFAEEDSRPDLELTKDIFIQRISEAFDLDENEAAAFSGMVEAFARNTGKSTDEYLRGFIGANVLAPERKEELAHEGGIASTSFENAEGPVNSLTIGRDAFKEDIRALFVTLEGADFHHAVHEFFHTVERLALSEDQIRLFEQALGKRRDAWQEKDLELMADRFEDYLGTGNAPSEAHANLFKAIADLLHQVVSFIKEQAKWNKKAIPEMRLSRDFSAAYDALFTKADPQEEFVPVNELAPMDRVRNIQAEIEARTAATQARIAAAAPEPDATDRAIEELDERTAAEQALEDYQAPDTGTLAPTVPTTVPIATGDIVYVLDNPEAAPEEYTKFVQGPDYKEYIDPTGKAQYRILPDPFGAELIGKPFVEGQKYAFQQSWEGSEGYYIAEVDVGLSLQMAKPAFSRYDGKYYPTPGEAQQELEALVDVLGLEEVSDYVAEAVGTEISEQIVEAEITQEIPEDPPAATTAIAEPDPEAEIGEDEILADDAASTVEAGVEVVELSLDELKLSDDVPNFKDGADNTGVVERIEGSEYQRTGTAPIVVWQRLNGDLEVITGRHRLDLARRTGETHIPAQVVRESEGFTGAMAITFDAESNIRDGQGSVKDYANYFRFSETTEEEASSRGLLARDKGRKGYAIGRYATDGLYTLYRNEQINETKAAGIAAAAPKNAQIQDAGIKRAKELSADELVNYLNIIQDMHPGTAAEQTDLFGKNDEFMLEAERLAREAVKKQGELSQESRALKSALRMSRGEQQKILGKYGYQAGDAYAVQERVDELDIEIEAWKNWTTDSEKHEELRERLSKNMLLHPAPPMDSQAWHDYYNGGPLDENGFPVVFYHGTQRPDRIGTRFRADRAVAGPMQYFTDDTEKAGGYARIKADNSFEGVMYEDWFTININGRDLNMKQAWYSLGTEKRAEIAERLPHVVNYDYETEEELDEYRYDPKDYGLSGKDHWDWTIKSFRGNVLMAAVDIWLNSGTLVRTEEEFLDILRIGGVRNVSMDSPYWAFPGVIPVYLAIKNPLVTTEAMSEELIEKIDRAGSLQPRVEEFGLWEKAYTDPQMWLERFHDDIEGNATFSWTVIPDWVTDVLRAEGYDGIIDEGGKYTDGKHVVAIPFDEGQIKSVFNRGTWDPSKSNMLFHQNGSDPWILKSAQIIGQKMKGPMQGDAVAAMLRNNGVKADEMKWTGLDDFLKTAGKVSPEALLDELSNHDVKITEIPLSSNAEEDETLIEKEAELQDKYDELYEDFGDLFEEGHRTLTAAGMDNLSANKLLTDFQHNGAPLNITSLEEFAPGFDFHRFANMGEDLAHAKQDVQEAHEAVSGQLEDQTKYSEYALDGGENYTELLLTLPRNAGSYNSPHWHEENVVAHVRYDERKTPAGDTLFIQEIQSDWHQEGRKRGYKGESSGIVEKIKAEFPLLSDDPDSWSHEWLINLGVSKEDADKWYEEKIQAGVPAAPWSKTWHELGFKRMLREAVEKGADRIAWTTGQQQADRYNLSNFITKIRHRVIRGAGGLPGYQIQAYNGQIELFDRGYSEDQLPEVVGQEMAQKIINREGKQSAEDLFYAERGKVEAIREVQVPLYSIVTATGDRVEDFDNKDSAEDFMETDPIFATEKGWDLITRDQTHFQLVFSGAGASGATYAYKNEAVCAAVRAGAQLSQVKALTIEGVDLNVGGEGMKGFYDKMLVKYANKYGKKWGSKVEPMMIDTRALNDGGVLTKVIPSPVIDTFTIAIGESDNPYQPTWGLYDTREQAQAFLDKYKANGNLFEPAEVWSMPITEEMKKSVSTGQMLFHAADDQKRMIAKAKKYFGVTDDSGETGFIMPNGDMLDMSGGYTGRRGVQHADAIEEANKKGKLGLKAKDDFGLIFEFQQRTQAIRYDAQKGYASASVKPTSAQMQKMLDGWEDYDKNFVYVSITAKSGRDQKSTSLPDPSMADLKAFFDQAPKMLRHLKDEWAGMFIYGEEIDEAIWQQYVERARGYFTAEDYQHDMEQDYGGLDLKNDIEAEQAKEFYEQAWSEAHEEQAVEQASLFDIPDPEIPDGPQYDYDEKKALAADVEDPLLAGRMELGTASEIELGTSDGTSEEIRAGAELSEQELLAATSDLLDPAKEIIAAGDAVEDALQGGLMGREPTGGDIIRNEREDMLAREAKWKEEMAEFDEREAARAAAPPDPAALEEEIAELYQRFEDALLADLATAETLVGDMIWKRAIIMPGQEDTVAAGEQLEKAVALGRKLQEAIDAKVLKKVKADAKERHRISRAKIYAKKRIQFQAFKDKLRTKQKDQRAKAKYKAAKKKLLADIMRPPGPSIQYRGYAEAIRDIQRGLDPVKRQKKTLYRRLQTRLFLEKNPEAAEFMDNEKLEKIYAVPISEMTMDQLEQINGTLDDLRKLGRLKRSLELTIEKRLRDRMKAWAESTVLRGEMPEKPIGGVKATKRYMKMLLPTLKPDRVAKLLDGSFEGGEDGVFTEWLQDRPNEAWSGMKKSMRGRTSPVQKLMYELKLTTDQLDRRILSQGFSWIGHGLDIAGFTYTNGKQPTIQDAMFWYIGMQNDRTRAALVHGNNIPESVIMKGIGMLTEEQRKFAAAIGKDFEENFPRLRDAFIDQFNMDLPGESNYVPMRRLMVSYDTRSEEIAAELTGRAGVRKQFIARNPTYARIDIKDEHQKPIRTDLVSLWLEGVKIQEGFIHQDRLIKQMHGIFESDQVRLAVQQKYGPDMNKWIKRYINDLAQADAYSAMSGMEKFSRVIRSNAAISWLSFNLSPNLKQLTGPMNYLADTGPYHLASAAAQFAAGKGKSIAKGKILNNTVIDFVDERTELLQNRVISQEFADLRSLNANLYEQMVKKIGTVGMKGLELADKVTVYIGWKAVYDKVLKKTGIEAEAIKAADKATTRTQPSHRVQDLAQMYREGEVFKWFTMFTSELSSVWNRLAFDVPLALKQRELMHALGDMVSFSIVGTGIAVAAGALQGDDDERRKKILFGLFSQYADAIPFVGSDILNIVSGKQFQTGGVKFFPTIDYIRYVPAQFARGDWETAVGNLIEGGAFAVGLPVSGPIKAVRTIKSQDMRDLLGWPRGDR